MRHHYRRRAERHAGYSPLAFRHDLRVSNRPKRGSASPAFCRLGQFKPQRESVFSDHFEVGYFLNEYKGFRPEITTVKCCITPNEIGVVQPSMFKYIKKAISAWVFFKILILIFSHYPLPGARYHF